MYSTLNNMNNQFDLMNTFRMLHPTNVEKILFSNVHKTFIKIFSTMNHISTHFKDWN